MVDLPIPALALLLIFGANWVLGGFLWLHKRHSAYNRSNDDKISDESQAIAATTPVAAPHGKQLSEPLRLTISSVRSLSGEVARLGAIMTFAYLCENHPLFPQGQKVHDLDMFWFLAGGLFISSVLNIRKSKGGDVLNREQTEEWKGWMQFMFLMYHYFSAKEVYNSIRVFITSYVWMTGFGNFSFFYLKGDFGAVRLLQMIWRLNFLVILLCMTMGNNYILYYICPLHTFYFFVVYAIMGIVPSANYSKWGIRWKLLIGAGVIYCVWDLDFGLFGKIFGFLGQEPTVGAGSGTLWEWYFRTSLDHWSTFLGMIFALNYPAVALWVKRVESMSPLRQWTIKGAVSVVLVSATVWWSANILTQQKIEYNTNNAYFGVVIPVLTYIFLRNLTPGLRTHYLEPLHSLGKITLETYLMQHHVWLTSNAKTLLVVVPGNHKVNLLVVTCGYVLISRELYRLTMSLRGMFLPDSLRDCLRNLAGMGVTLCIAAVTAAILKFCGATWVAVGVTVTALGVGITAVLHLVLDCRAKRTRSCISTTPTPAVTSYNGGLLSPKNFVVMSMGWMAVCLLLLSCSTRQSNVAPYSVGPHDACLQGINRGHWQSTVGACGGADSHEAAYCESHSWTWVDIPDQCDFHYMTPDAVQKTMTGKRVLLVGDSVSRFMYYSMIRGVTGGPTPMAHNTSAEKHSDFMWTDPDHHTEFRFLWGPTTLELTTRLSDFYMSQDVSKFRPDVIVMGSGLWDALSTQGNVTQYKSALSKLSTVLMALRSGQHAKGEAPLLMWTKITSTVVEHMLTEEKREYLSETVLGPFRDAVEKSDVIPLMDGIVDGLSLTLQRRDDSYDGVHYTDFVYDAFAQLVFNTLHHYHWGDVSTNSKASKSHVMAHRHIGGMGNAYLGIMVLCLAAVMVLTLDSFHGVARLATTVFGRDGGGVDGKGTARISWEESYGDLLRKLGKRPPRTATSGGVSNNAKVGGGEGLEAGRERRKSASPEWDSEEKALLVDENKIETADVKPSTWRK